MIQHISVRVPWHDHGWDGSICQDPGGNTSCLKLQGILKGKKELEEEEITVIDSSEEPEEYDTEIYSKESDANVNIDFIEEEITAESLFGKPEFVTWGCYIKLYKEKDGKDVFYHIPLERDKSRELFLIEKKMLGKQVGHRIYLSGSWYELKDYGWEEDFKEPT